MKKEKRALRRRLAQSYMSSVISISLVLLLIGVSGFLAVNAGSVSNYFRENIKLAIFFENSATEDESKTIFADILKKSYTKEAIYISKEEGAKEMIDVLGEDFLSTFEVNPIPISIELFLNADYLNSDSLRTIEQQLTAFKSIKEVTYQDSLVKLINENLETAGVVLIIFIALMLFVSVVLINNTVRLNLFSKRFTIYTMKLVGAKRAFIRRPFLNRAVIQGSLSGIISALILGGIVYLIYEDLPELFAILDIKLIVLVLGGIVCVGVLLCLLSTYFIVNRLVSMTGDDIYY